MYLTNTEIHEIADAALRAGLINPAIRQNLFMGIKPGYVANLPIVPIPTDQVISDLNLMNNVDYLVGYKVPLKIWLDNARRRASNAGLPEQEALKRFADKVDLASQKKIKDSISTTTPTVQRIIHNNDLLPFGFLDKATMVGNAVARLTVPRYDFGNVTGGYYGTGWLIGQQYLITNHHVINAREDGEKDASPSDMRLQAQHTEVQFDYNGLNHAGTVVAVDSLEMADKDLDFAILKLAEPITNRTSLSLALENIDSLAEEIQGNKQAVNIIQHPGGNPKSMGIRNNSIHQVSTNNLSYFTDTMGGSSGSPVCNDNWAVVALHKLTRPIKVTYFQGEVTAFENAGTRIDVIIKELKTNYSDLWARINAVVV